MSSTRHCRAARGADVAPLVRIIAARHLPIASLALLGLSLAPAAMAASITVTGPAVDDVVNGNCSIVEAVRAANNNAAVDGCAAGSGADVIVLPASGSFSFDGSKLFGLGSQNALPEVSSNITLQGNGSTLARSSSASADFRIASVTGSGKLTVQDTTITGGRSEGSGGALFSGSETTLSLVRSKVSNSYSADYGGGIFAMGVLTVTNSSISGNTASQSGGGVYMYGDGAKATVTGSTISGNTAFAYGGGVYAAGGASATITNSTVSGNAVSTDDNGYGGGMALRYSAATLTNSTITGNRAGPGNGGGVNSYGSEVAMRNSIIARQRGGRNCVSDSPLAAAGAINLDDKDGSTCEGFSVSVTGFLLAALADNGGPTLTHALTKPDSDAAIDAGDNTVCATDLPSGAGNVDQRGRPRSAGARCDLGAFEYQPPVAPPPPPSDGGSTGTPPPASGDGGGGGGNFGFVALLGLGALWLRRRLRLRSG
ncbi:MAG TPA: choice-of-anchor Q domain-containing protein [Solimonas sp.]|nr:choice-of-anchor Q domain-containing protein [Solimonas sp.]